MGVQATITAGISGAYYGVNDLSSIQAQFGSSLSPQVQIAAGLLAGQADLCFLDTRTIAASGTDVLDLSGTALQDPFGVNLAFAKIMAILVHAAPANTNNVVVGATAATQFLGPLGASTHTYTLTPGGFWLAVDTTLAGWASAAGATDLWKFANSGSGTGVTFDIALFGRSS